MKKIFLFLGLFILIIACKTSKIPASGSSCGDCPNPLVRTEPMSIDGDIPEHFKQYEVDFAQNFWSGWAFLEFKEKNPCADLYYLLDQEGNISRHGAKEGEAKYVVRPWAVITEEEGYAVVKEASGWNGDDWQKTEDVVIPKLGNIQVHYDLIALKSGEIYDFGVWDIDWVSEPPEGKEYFFPDGKVEKDGEVFLPNDGIIKGDDWGPGTISNQTIYFNNGDIGKTIRELETPTDCKMTVDDETNYPDYFNLTFSKFVNQRQKIMPSQVKVAIKAQKGKILNGDKLGEWRIFNTLEGNISEIVRYRPPDCKEDNKDVIEIANVCQFHDGELSVGKHRFSKTVKNEYCQIWEAKITYSEQASCKDRFYEQQEYSNGSKTMHEMKFNLQRAYSLQVEAKLFPKKNDPNSFESENEFVVLKDNYTYDFDELIELVNSPTDWAKTVIRIRDAFRVQFNNLLPLKVTLHLPQKDGEFYRFYSSVSDSFSLIEYEKELEEYEEVTGVAEGITTVKGSNFCKGNGKVQANDNEVMGGASHSSLPSEVREILLIYSQNEKVLRGSHEWLDDEFENGVSAIPDNFRCSNNDDFYNDNGEHHLWNCSFDNPDAPYVKKKLTWEFKKVE